MPTVPGSRWADRREQLDMDQSTAAAPLNISKRTLQNLETVTGYYVSGRVIHRAARLYRCSVEYLRGETDTPGKPPANPPTPPRREPAGDPTAPPRSPGREPKGPPRSDLAAAS